MSEKLPASEEGNILSTALQRLGEGANFSVSFRGGKARLALRLIVAFERYDCSQAKSDLLRLSPRVFLTPTLSAIYIMSQSRNYKIESEVVEEQLTLLFKAPT